MIWGRNDYCTGVFVFSNRLNPYVQEGYRMGKRRQNEEGCRAFGKELE